jgi:DNA modification methylase
MNKIFNCDIMEGFKKLDDASIDCVITSPPYWQLRDYGFDGQWGLELTFQEYLEHLWEMMDEIHRVLKDTGTVWINLGDTYSTKSGGLASGGSKPSKSGDYLTTMRIDQPTDLPSKNLLLIPHRFAIGCMDKGWTIRNDIVWAKRNAMPEPVKDRFSKKHEYIFFMTKKPKGYYFDLDSIRDEHKYLKQDSKRKDFNKPSPTIDKHLGTGGGVGKTRNSRPRSSDYNTKGKNPGDISDFWDVPTKSNKSMHLASYNTDLIDKPIIAGCPPDGVILDPFSGTGTTLVRASQLGRQYVGFEASDQFFKIVEENIEIEEERKNAPSLDDWFSH